MVFCYVLPPSAYKRAAAPVGCPAGWLGALSLGSPKVHPGLLHHQVFLLQGHSAGFLGSALIAGSRIRVCEVSRPDPSA